MVSTSRMSDLQTLIVFDVRKMDSRIQAVKLYRLSSLDVRWRQRSHPSHVSLRGGPILPKHLRVPDTTLCDKRWRYSVWGRYGPVRDQNLCRGPMSRYTYKSHATEESQSSNCHIACNMVGFMSFSFSIQNGHVLGKPQYLWHLAHTVQTINTFLLVGYKRDQKYAW